MCTPFYQCSNATVFNDGRDHIGVRFNVALETELCHYLEMCCDPEDILEVEKIESVYSEHADGTTEGPHSSLIDSTTKVEQRHNNYDETTAKSVTSGEWDVEDNVPTTERQIDQPYTFVPITSSPYDAATIEPIVTFGHSNKEEVNDN